jgi:hypothetical protein
MKAGDSHVAELLDLIAHQIGGDRCLFGYRDIAGSRTNN